MMGWTAVRARSSLQISVLVLVLVMFRVVVHASNPRANVYNSHGPGLVYKMPLGGEAPGTEGYDYRTGFGHQGSRTKDCKEKIAGYTNHCQGKGLRSAKAEECEEMLSEWQAQCLFKDGR